MYILSSVNKCPTYQKIYWFSDTNLQHPTTEIMWFNIPWYWFMFEAQTCYREHKSGVSSKVLPLTCHIQLRSFNGLMIYYSNSRIGVLSTNSPKYRSRKCSYLTCHESCIVFGHGEKFPTVKAFSRIFSRSDLIGWFCNNRDDSMTVPGIKSFTFIEEEWTYRLRTNRAYPITSFLYFAGTKL